MAFKKRTGYRSVAGVLPEITRYQGWEAKLDIHSFFPRWEEVVGKEVADCSRPLKVVKDTLWLEVENSTWMQQLQFEKMRILEDINATLKITRLRDIRFVLPQRLKKEAAREPEIVFVPPDSEELQRFEQQVSAIEDDEIRQALVRLWYLSKACRREGDK